MRFFYPHKSCILQVVIVMKMDNHMVKKQIFFLFVLLVFFVQQTAVAQQQPASDPAKMEWFNDAKLGIFIHWGIYSVNGISESWSFFNNYINYDSYLKQLDGFTATNYDPADWAALIGQSGAKYAVITTKHHDGVALWDSKAPDGLTTSRHTAAKQDVLTPFVKELRAANLKVGLYFSLPDWRYPDYDVFTRVRRRYTLSDEPHRWENFQNYCHAQLNELSMNYNPDLLWFDGDWEHSDKEWGADSVKQNLRRYNPDIIVNSRG